MKAIQVRPVAAILALAVALISTAEAYPNAAGRCPAGEAAVAQSHVADGKSITTGSLMDGGFSVLLNGVPLGGKPPSFRVGEEESLTITSDSATFRGFLIRIAPPEGIVADVRDAIQPVSSNDTDVQVATTTCVQVEQVGGLTHTDRTDKTEVSATLFVEEAISGLTIDVTIVGENSGGSSSYWYSRFEINSIVAVDPESPVAAPPAAIISPSATTTQPSMAPVVAEGSGEDGSAPTAAPAIAVDSGVGSEESESEETSGTETTTTTGDSNPTSAASSELKNVIGFILSCLVSGFMLQ